MTKDATNLVLDLLRKIRGDIAELRVDVTELKSRTSAIEDGLQVIRGDIVNIHSVLLVHTKRFDRIEERFTRVERRLELAETH